MSIDGNRPNPNPVLTEPQIYDLARPLAKIVTEYYKDPRHEEDFQKWLKEREQPPETK